jgi:hypothetical protein
MGNIYAACIAAVLVAAPAAASKAMPNVRTITADQRHACKYLGPAGGFSHVGNHHAEKALRNAMLKAEQAGGNALYIINTSENETAATVNGEAYSCPDTAF